MKRKSMKKSILACGISLALVIGSVPVMSFAEDTVTGRKSGSGSRNIFWRKVRI